MRRISNITGLCRKFDCNINDETKIIFLFGGLESQLRNQALCDRKTPADVLAKFKLVRAGDDCDSLVNNLAVMSETDL